MTNAFLAPILLGLDGFFVCLALGLPSVRRGVHAIGTFGPVGTLGLAAMFGLCDGLALLAGGALPPVLSCNAAVAPVLIALWAMLVLWLTLSGSRVLLPLLPLLLACDNLLAGAGVAVGLFDAAVSAMASATVAAAGLVVGRTLACRAGLTSGRLAGAGLLLVAGFRALAA